MKQQRDRYDQERALELEREDRASLDAEGRVRRLEDDYRAYKNRKVAAEVRLREKHNQPFDDAYARPSVAPDAPALPETSRADPPRLKELSAEFLEYRKLRKSYPDLPCNNSPILSFTWRRSEGVRRVVEKRTARLGGSRRVLGPRTPRAAAISTGVRTSATTEGIRRNSASVAPLPDILRDPGDEDEEDGSWRLRRFPGELDDEPSSSNCRD